MTILLQFFRLSASFCPGAACPAVGPQAAQILRQVGIAAPDTYHFPEKLIPLMIVNALADKPP